MGDGDDEEPGVGEAGGSTRNGDGGNVERSDNGHSQQGIDGEEDRGGLDVQGENEGGREVGPSRREDGTIDTVGAEGFASSDVVQAADPAEGATGDTTNGTPAEPPLKPPIATAGTPQQSLGNFAKEVHDDGSSSYSTKPAADGTSTEETTKSESSPHGADPTQSEVLNPLRGDVRMNGDSDEGSAAAEVAISPTLPDPDRVPTPALSRNVEQDTPIANGNAPASPTSPTDPPETSKSGPVHDPPSSEALDGSPPSPSEGQDPFVAMLPEIPNGVWHQDEEEIGEGDRRPPLNPHLITGSRTLTSPPSSAPFTPPPPPTSIPFKLIYARRTFLASVPSAQLTFRLLKARVAELVDAADADAGGSLEPARAPSMSTSVSSPSGESSRTSPTSPPPKSLLLSYLDARGDRLALSSPSAFRTALDTHTVHGRPHVYLFAAWVTKKGGWGGGVGSGALAKESAWGKREGSWEGKVVGLGEGEVQRGDADADQSGNWTKKVEETTVDSGQGSREMPRRDADVATPQNAVAKLPPAPASTPPPPPHPRLPLSSSAPSLHSPSPPTVRAHPTPPKSIVDQPAPKAEAQARTQRLPPSIPSPTAHPGLLSVSTSTEDNLAQRLTIPNPPPPLPSTRPADVDRDSVKAFKRAELARANSKLSESSSGSSEGIVSDTSQELSSSSLSSADSAPPPNPPSSPPPSRSPPPALRTPRVPSRVPRAKPATSSSSTPTPTLLVHTSAPVPRHRRGLTPTYEYIRAPRPEGVMKELARARRTSKARGDDGHGKGEERPGWDASLKRKGEEEEKKRAEAERRKRAREGVKAVDIGTDKGGAKKPMDGAEGWLGTQAEARKRVGGRLGKSLASAEEVGRRKATGKATAVQDGGKQSRLPPLPHQPQTRSMASQTQTSAPRANTPPTSRAQRSSDSESQSGERSSDESGREDTWTEKRRHTKRRGPRGSPKTHQRNRGSDPSEASDRDSSPGRSSSDESGPDEASRRPPRLPPPELRPHPRRSFGPSSMENIKQRVHAPNRKGDLDDDPPRKGRARASDVGTREPARQSTKRFQDTRSGGSSFVDALGSQRSMALALVESDPGSSGDDADAEEQVVRGRRQGGDAKRGSRLKSRRSLPGSKGSSGQDLVGLSTPPSSTNSQTSLVVHQQPVQPVYMIAPPGAMGYGGTNFGVPTFIPGMGMMLQLGMPGLPDTPMASLLGAAQISGAQSSPVWPGATMINPMAMQQTTSFIAPTHSQQQLARPDIIQQLPPIQAFHQSQMPYILPPINEESASQLALALQPSLSSRGLTQSVGKGNVVASGGVLVGPGGAIKGSYLKGFLKGKEENAFR
ncbi:hypothetical protein M427DRAFT_451419 [Gonapodya prolifera JEL478]|uniref:Uncharacterized protein n=1 Tax=Gonapodya prolifera (strain JEL478) TaxID=1344416 RepID=A0A139ASL8_GONPJ|nr:hypothetical protein M427DRAFT_451419 [Gonapodya prolifera JEL478]|eukprot:KXS19475.1 hypothetical protein M427DRAFT_451419 [Gonapodya prolifera JEL478]